MKTVLKAILYLRVSTEEQGRSGYSLPQQLKALQEYCKDNGIEVVGTYEEEFSGNSLDRPALDMLRDRVSLGGIDIVLVQDRERFSRNRTYRLVLAEEFQAHGTTIRALNDRGDDSPEGTLTDGMLDLLAEYELAKTLERTRRGKLQKAQEGKIVGTGSAPYGFYYQDDHYHIDLDRMPYAREIFGKAAAGDSLYSIVEYLTRVGAPTPKCGRWHASTVRQIIQSDTYAGTFYWNKNRVTTKHVSAMKNGQKIYKRKVTTEPRPRSEWISIPVPDSGIDAETIARARESLNGNVKSVSMNSNRTWELSGGIGICSECGRHLISHTVTNPAKKKYFYYRCSNREHGACSNMKNYPAADLEERVNEALVEASRPDTWKDFVDDLCSRKLEDLRKLYRSDPKQIKENLAKRKGDLEAKIFRAQELFMAGDISRPRYEEKKTTHQEEMRLVEEEFSKITNLNEEMKNVEVLRRTLLCIESPLSGRFAFIPPDGYGDDYPDDDPDDEYFDLGIADKVGFELGFGYGSRKGAAERRLEIYRKMGIQVRVGEEELEISLGIGEPLVSNLKTASASTSG